MSLLRTRKESVTEAGARMKIKRLLEMEQIKRNAAMAENGYHDFGVNGDMGMEVSIGHQVLFSELRGDKNDFAGF
jgi:hypothetical protein